MDYRLSFSKYLVFTEPLKKLSLLGSVIVTFQQIKTKQETIGCLRSRLNNQFVPRRLHSNKLQKNKIYKCENPTWLKSEAFRPFIHVLFPSSDTAGSLVYFWMLPLYGNTFRFSLVPVCSAMLFLVNSRAMDQLSVHMTEHWQDIWKPFNSERCCTNADNETAGSHIIVILSKYFFLSYFLLDISFILALHSGHVLGNI